MMSDYEKCRREHPAQVAADKRTLKALERDLRGGGWRHRAPRGRRFRMMWRF